MYTTSSLFANARTALALRRWPVFLNADTEDPRKEVRASLCSVEGSRHEMNNPIRAIQVTRGLGGSPRRFPIMACYLHHRRVVCFLLFVTDTK